MIRADDLTAPAVRALVAEHLAHMHATSPPESVHALPLSSLVGDGMRFFTAWDVEGQDGDVLLGMAALKDLDAVRVEVKSMRTTEAARGRGVGRALLQHLLDEARTTGHTSVWLETGVEDTFAAARRLYETAGFTVCPPFGDYTDDPLSVFMTRSL